MPSETHLLVREPTEGMQPAETDTDDPRSCRTARLHGTKFQGLTNSYMTDAERANIDPDSREHYNRVWGSKIQVIGWSFYACILWSLKFCVTAFYGRLTYALQIENTMDNG